MADVPGLGIAPWPTAKSGRVHPQRQAEFWRRVRGKKIACDLCYKVCQLNSGETGWCRYRENRGGRMELLAHGVLASAVRQMRGYQVNPFTTWKPGGLSVLLGGTYCTAGCVFCFSKEITWRPERVPWGYGEGRPGQTGGWYMHRAVVHPLGAIELAQTWGCSQIEFGVNEPMLTWEYTYDVARLAKRAGLDIAIETNGFSLEQPVRRLARFVDAVILGIKGSASPGFYDKWMKSPDAVSTVLRSGEQWRESGVHLTVLDVIAPPQMQDDREAEECQRRLYSWIADKLGPMTFLLIQPMLFPGPSSELATRRWNGVLLPASATRADYEGYLNRVRRAFDIARESGLLYAHTLRGSLIRQEDRIDCHNCGGVLVRFPLPERHNCLMENQFCSHHEHEQHVTNGRCDHCGARVPIVVLPRDELDIIREYVS